MALALDEPTKEDTVIEDGGLNFCIASSLLQQVGSVTIDMSYMGFVVEPEIPLAAAPAESNCGGCSSSSGCSSS